MILGGVIGNIPSETSGYIPRKVQAEILGKKTAGLPARISVGIMAGITLLYHRGNVKKKPRDISGILKEIFGKNPARIL